MNALSICILGCGNIGSAIARGLEKSGQFAVSNITLTRRKTQPLDELKNLLHGSSKEWDEEGNLVRDQEYVNGVPI